LLKKMPDHLELFPEADRLDPEKGTSHNVPRFKMGQIKQSREKNQKRLKA